MLASIVALLFLNARTLIPLRKSDLNRILLRGTAFLFDVFLFVDLGYFLYFTKHFLVILYSATMLALKEFKSKLFKWRVYATRVRILQRCIGYSLRMHYLFCWKYCI